MFGIAVREHSVDPKPFGPRGRPHLEAVRRCSQEDQLATVRNQDDPGEVRKVLLLQDVREALDHLAPEDGVDLSDQARRSLSDR